MKFLIDTQLPRLLVRALNEMGQSAEHVLELRLEQSPDNDVWRHAQEHGFVIVTKDGDFAEWIISGRSGPQVVWLRIGNCTNSELLTLLMPVWSQVVDALERGDSLIEIS